MTQLSLFGEADRVIARIGLSLRALTPTHHGPRSTPTDITARKHKGDHQSTLANAHIAPKKVAIRKRIHQFLTSEGQRGATTNEVAAGLNLKVQTVSGRMSEMKCPDSDYQIFWNGEKRASIGSQPSRVFVTSKGQLK